MRVKVKAFNKPQARMTAFACSFPVPECTSLGWVRGGFLVKYIGFCQKSILSSSDQMCLYSLLLFKEGAAMPAKKCSGCCTMHGLHRQCGCGESFVPASLGGHWSGVGNQDPMVAE